MKTKIFALLFLACSVCCLTECKKGEDDPFISLRSRKARVAGSWKMTSGSYSLSHVDNGGAISYSENTSYNGTTFNTDRNSGPTSQNSSGPYTLKVAFKKDGSFEWEETTGLETATTKGTWNFSGKVGKNKNKEQIILTATSFSNSTGSSSFTGNQLFGIYNIKELRNKKMVIVSEVHSERLEPAALKGYTDTKKEFVLEQ